MAPEPCFNVGDVTSTGRGQAAHRADAGQRRSPGATLRRRRLVRELQREQLLRGDGHKWGDGARGQEAHLQGRCSSFPARWKRWCHRNLALTRALAPWPQVRIREATGLPLNLSNFVFCQYTFWEQAEPAVAPPMVSPDRPSPRSPDAYFTVQFDHCKVS